MQVYPTSVMNFGSRGFRLACNEIEPAQFFYSHTQLQLSFLPCLSQLLAEGGRE